MDLVIAGLIFLLALWLIFRMMSARQLEWCHLGLIGTFAIGYYVLPVVLKTMSGLASFSEDDVIAVLLLHGLFLVAVVAGAAGAGGLRMRSFSLSPFDNWLFEHRRKWFVLCLLIHIALFTTTEQTSYSARDATDFFLARNPLAATSSIVSSLALATMAFTLASELRSGRKAYAYAMITAFFGIVVMSLSTAQRLAIVAPLAMVLGALFVTGQKRRAVQSFGILLITLAVVSPFAVFLRQAQSKDRGMDRALAVGREFSYDGHAPTSIVRSLVERSDLLANSVLLKHYIDDNDYVGWKFYYSVLISPVPRSLLGNKPYLLSSDGTMWGDISVLCWSLTSRGIGSVTAFGGITAYREGGWIAVAIDGFATGVLFAFLARWLGNGGAVAKVLYIAVFPLLSIKRVPPGFFEAMAELMPFLPLICVLLLLNAFARQKGIPVLDRRSDFPSQVTPPPRSGSVLPATIASCNISSRTCAQR